MRENKNNNDKNVIAKEEQKEKTAPEVEEVKAEEAKNEVAEVVETEVTTIVPEFPEEMNMDEMFKVLNKSKSPLKQNITLAKYMDERNTQRTKVVIHKMEQTAEDLNTKAEVRHNQLMEAVGGEISTAAYVVGLVIAVLLVFVCNACLPAGLIGRKVVSVLIGVAGAALIMAVWPVSSSHKGGDK